MQDRRHSVRDKVLLGGVAEVSDSGSTMDCVVRNFSEDGACIELEAPATLPDEVQLTIARKGCAYRATIVWRHANRYGVSLRAMPAPSTPADIATRLRQSEKKKRELQRRINELLGED